MRVNDSTTKDFTPWWTRCDINHFDLQLARYKRALLFCRGRASDLAPHLRAFILFLENYREVVLHKLSC
jgi:hypothetical protein